MFLVAVLQNIKIVDLTAINHDSAVMTDDGMTDVDMAGIEDKLLGGLAYYSAQSLNKNEERALARGNTAGFTGGGHPSFMYLLYSKAWLPRLGCEFLQTRIRLV